MAEPFWKETILTWHEQGLPVGLHPCEHFGLDIRYAYFLDTSPRFERKLLRKEDAFEIWQDHYGRTIKEIDADTPEQPLSWALRGEEDWESIASRLEPSADRISFGYYGDYFDDSDRGSGIEAARARRGELVRDDDTFVLINTLGCYETAMRLLGDEHLLMAMADTPALVRSVFEKIADLLIGTIDLLLEHLPAPDGVFLAEDIAYKNGPLFSPAMYRELLQPVHRRLCGHLRRRGLYVLLHTDGYFLPLASDIIDAGVHAIQPLEAKAGLEAEEVKKELGRRVVLMGNISVPELCSGPRRMKKELHDRLPILKAGGGYIYSSDHSIPPTMPFADYGELVDIVKTEGRYGP